MTINTPQIVVSFGTNATEYEITNARQLGMSIAEIRADLIQDTAMLINKLSNTPILLTIRSQKEGGMWHKTEQQKLSLCEKLLPTITMMDIELTTDVKIDLYQLAKQHDKQVIFSTHNFNDTPCLSQIQDLADLAYTISNDAIFKIATTVNSQKDLYTLIQFLQNNQNRKTVVIGMGELGKVSRIFFAALGSKLVFTYIGKPTAPGQLSLLETKELLSLFYNN